MSALSLFTVVQQLGGVQLPPQDAAFVGNIKILLEEGLDDSVSDDSRKRLLQLHAKFIGLQQVKAQPRGITTIADVDAVIAELDEAIIALSDKDRDYVQGVKLLRDMSEPIPVSVMQALTKIYVEFRKGMHKGLG